jgi:hypothetical protein
MFGRRAILPVDLTEDKHTCEDHALAMAHFNDDELDKMMEARRVRLESVKANIVLAQERQEEQYDRKHANPDVFAVGSLVLKKDFTRKKRAGGNLITDGLGPTEFLVH